MVMVAIVVMVVIMVLVDLKSFDAFDEDCLDAVCEDIDGTEGQISVNIIYLLYQAPGTC